MNDNDGLDARLQQLYRQLPTQEPSSHIDQVILNAAKIKKTWHQPFSVAATVVMATSLIWYWQAEQPQQLQQAMSVATPSAKIYQDAPVAEPLSDELVKEESIKNSAPQQKTLAMPSSVPQQEKSRNNDAPQTAKKSQTVPSIMSDNLTTLKEDNSVEVAAPKPVLEAITKTKKEEVNQPIAQGALGASQAQEKDNAQRQLSEKRQANPIMAKQALMRDAQARLDETKPERAESKQLVTTRLQEVQRVFEQHHVALKNIYLRELSDSLNIKGELHLKLAITATGKVSQCEVISSNLNNLGLETKLVALVKSFEFGEGEAWHGEYVLGF
ncbi:MAG: AgmX/PglI C-terminal domain-containing protein [Moraxellaceae bacterium]|nr:AgmX/PglI C-terminal domain-containing protein [Moraxellaceae bacterium]